MIGEFIELSNGIESGTSVSIMNSPEIGVKANLSKYKATIVSHNKEVCTIDGSIQKNNYETVASFDSDFYTIKSFGQNNAISQVGAIVDFIGDAIKGENAVNNVLPHIYDSNNNMIGSCEMLWSGSGINKFPYIKYIINNTIMYAYELSHDTTDILYCIYNEQNQMVATISRSMNISHGHAKYTIYSCNEKWFKYVSLVAICWAISHFEEDGGAGTFTKKTSGTLIPELLEKYNPSFIDQVKQKEGVQNLPENMSLVSEKIAESKKGSDVKLFKIIAFIVFFVIFFILGYSFFK